MGKFINPFTDIGFKIIFGQEFSKSRLLDFLNTLLEGERTITDLKFLDKEQPAFYDGDRSPIYDILCETATGEKIIVEMQNREHPHFRERMLYYASEAIVCQGEKGEDWGYDIKAVYMVAFTNFSLTGYSGGCRIATDCRESNAHDMGISCDFTTSVKKIIKSHKKNCNLFCRLE